MARASLSASAARSVPMCPTRASRLPLEPSAGLPFESSVSAFASLAAASCDPSRPLRGARAPGSVCVCRGRCSKRPSSPSVTLPAPRAGTLHCSPPSPSDVCSTFGDTEAGNGEPQSLSKTVPDEHVRDETSEEKSSSLELPSVDRSAPAASKWDIETAARACAECCSCSCGDGSRLFSPGLRSRGGT